MCGKRYIYMVKIFQWLILFTVISCSTAQAQGCFVRASDSGLVLDNYAGFEHNKVFLVGEFHGVYSVPAVKLAMIKYVHEHNKVNDVFMEIGYATACPNWPMPMHVFVHNLC